MKTCNIFFIFVLISALNLSCHLSKKEVRSEQTDHIKTPSPIASKEVIQDSLSAMTLQKHTLTMNDTIVGTIYVAGNEPFTHLMLAISPDVQYLVDADSSSKVQLWQLQGKKVGIIGIKRSSPMGTSIQAKSFHQSP